MIEKKLYSAEFKRETICLQETNGKTTTVIEYLKYGDSPSLHQYVQTRNLMYEAVLLKADRVLSLDVQDQNYSIYQKAIM